MDNKAEITLFSEHNPI